jgi:N-acetylglucosaminyldiphosphoundecaprenol N-acetyl-beta-D-mannosaminyltransferase
MRIELMNVPVDVMTLSETLREIEASMISRIRLQHVALNVAKLVSLQKDTALREDVASADIVGIDGMGIVLAVRVLGHKDVPRVSGIDLMNNVLSLCADKGFRPYFLGAKPGVVGQAVSVAVKKYPNLQFAGFQDGYFSEDDEPFVMEAVKAAGADCLFIGMPSPRKERLLRTWRDKLDVPFIMGVGGSIDILAGTTKRAPQWMQRTGFEWVYRIYQEPGRMWRRYLTTNTKFAFMLLGLMALKIRKQNKRTS